jgi:uncharacterized protein YkwD
MLMRLRHFLAALPLVFLVQCMSGSVPRPAATGKITTSSRDAGQAATMISRYRAAHGLGPVRVDAQLGRAAEHQARAVAMVGELTHGDFAGRMKEYGIRGSAAENLAAGKDTLQGTMDQWKSSPGHNANLLLAGASRIGLVEAETPGTGYNHYWALVLASDPGSRAGPSGTYTGLGSPFASSAKD